MTLVGLIFLLLAILLVVSVLFPSWNFRNGLVLTVNAIVTLIISLLVLFIIYLIVVALFGAGPIISGAR